MEMPPQKAGQSNQPKSKPRRFGHRKSGSGATHSEVDARQFNHFVGKRDQIRRQHNAADLRSLQVDHERTAARTTPSDHPYLRAKPPLKESQRRLIFATGLP